MKNKRIISPPIIIIITVITLGIIIFQNLSKGSNTTPIINEPVGQEESLNETLTVYYDNSEENQFVIVFSKQSNFSSLNEKYELKMLSQFKNKEYFSSVESPYYLANENVLYIGFLKLISDKVIDHSCNYVTDYYRIDLNTRDRKLVYSHSDCSLTSPNKAPGVIERIINDRYLILSVGLCSECDTIGPEKYIGVDITTKEVVLFDGGVVDSITDDSVSSFF